MAQSDAAERVTEPVVKSQNSSPFVVYSPETVAQKGWKVLLYGASGSGKTYMAGTFPDPLFLDLEDGMRTVLSLNRKILRFPKDPKEQVTDFKQVKQFWQIVKNMPPERAPFKTIVIDSLNELQLLVLKNLLGEFQASRIYEDQPTQADYGKLARDMQNIVRDFIQLPYHIVMTASATDPEYEDDKVFPLFIGKKTGPDLRRIIEQIGYCFSQQKTKNDPVEHVVGFQDNPRYLAKDRTSSLVKVLPNTFEAMNSVANKQGANR